MVSEDSQPALEVLQGNTHLESPGWETVYRKNVESVYRFVFSRVGNKPDAEDITAEVFLKCLDKLQRDAGEAQVHAYLMAAARNAITDFWRVRYRAATPLPEDYENQLPGEQTSSDATTSRRAHVILSRLPDRWRQVLELRFLRGYSIRETAHSMGISEGNVKVMQLRALRRAADCDGDEQ